MSDPISDPLYWKARLNVAEKRQELWKAVFMCPKERWLAIEAKHREILAKHIKPSDSVLDCACGYARLPDMLPKSPWKWDYLGIDLSQDFIDLARIRFPTWSFEQSDLRDLSWVGTIKYEWAVMISVRPMVIRNMGQETWNQMEAQIRRVASKLLYLEYDPDCNGFVE